MIVWKGWNEKNNGLQGTVDKRECSQLFEAKLLTTSGHPGTWKAPWSEVHHKLENGEHKPLDFLINSTFEILHKYYQTLRKHYFTSEGVDTFGLYHFNVGPSKIWDLFLEKVK